jgi:hypothetical protein
MNDFDKIKNDLINNENLAHYLEFSNFNKNIFILEIINKSKKSIEDIKTKFDEYELIDIITKNYKEYFKYFSNEDIINVLNNLTLDFEHLYCNLLNLLPDIDKKTVLIGTMNKFESAITNYSDTKLKYFILKNDDLITNCNYQYILLNSLPYEILLSDIDLLDYIEYDLKLKYVEAFLKNNKNDCNINKNIITSIKGNDLYNICCKYNIDILNFIIQMRMPFEKAVFFLKNYQGDKLNILTKLYPKTMEKYKCEKFDEIIKLIKINKFNEFKNIDLTNIEINNIIVEDLLEFEYDDFLSNINIDYFKNNKIPECYIKMFISYLIKIEKLDCDVSFINLFNYKNNDKIYMDGAKYNCESNKILINFNSYKIKKDLINEIMDIYHEMRHAKQFKNITSDISYKNLLYTMDFLIEKSDHNYYNENYEFISYEIDAIAYSIYATYSFLSKIDKNIAAYFNNKYKDEFINLQNKIKSNQTRYTDINLITYFFKIIPNDLIIKYRNEFDILKYIINEQGNLYTNDEINNFFNNSSGRVHILYENYLKKIKPSVDSIKI